MILPFEKPHRTDIEAMVRLAIPVVVVQVGMMLFGVVDTMVVGRLSSAALASVALGHVAVITISSFGVGLLLGIDPLLNQALGARDRNAFRRTVQRGFVLAGALMIPSALFLIPIGEVLALLGQPPETVPLAAAYSHISIPGLLPFYGWVVLRLTLQAMGRLRSIVATVIAVNIFNLAADWVLVFGAGPIPQLGPIGSAWASTIARTLLFVILLVVDRKDLWPLLRFDREAVRWRPLIRTARLGLPIGFNLQLEIVAFSVIALLMGGLGTVMMAAHQVAINIASLTFMVPLGVSQATAVRVGNAIDRAQSALHIGTGYVALEILVEQHLAVEQAKRGIDRRQFVRCLYRSQQTRLREAPPQLLIEIALQSGHPGKTPAEVARPVRALAAEQGTGVIRLVHPVGAEIVQLALHEHVPDTPFCLEQRARSALILTVDAGQERLGRQFCRRYLDHRRQPFGQQFEHATIDPCRRFAVVQQHRVQAREVTRVTGAFELKQGIDEHQLGQGPGYAEHGFAHLAQAAVLDPHQLAHDLPGHPVPDMPGLACEHHRLLVKMQTLSVQLARRHAARIFQFHAQGRQLVVDLVQQQFEQGQFEQLHAFESVIVARLFNDRVVMFDDDVAKRLHNRFAERLNRLFPQVLDIFADQRLDVGRACLHQAGTHCHVDVIIIYAARKAFEPKTGQLRALEPVEDCVGTGPRGS